MGLDHSVGNSGRPFECAYREERQMSVACDISQAICEGQFALTAQARDPMGWNSIRNIGNFCRFAGDDGL